MNEDLNKWFKEKWVNIGKKVDGKHPPCGTSGEKRGYAKCVPAAKAAGMNKKEKESATKEKELHKMMQEEVVRVVVDKVKHQ